MTAIRAGSFAAPEIAAAAAVLFVLSFAPPAAAQAIWVSIPPQVEMVQNVAGGRLEIGVLVQPGSSPATYEPTPKQMAALSEARLFVTIGVAFEGVLIERLREVAPRLVIVDGTRGIELQPMEGDHGHGVEGGLDPHFWLDPLLVRNHAATICDALCRLVPDRCSDLQANLTIYHGALEAAHQRIAARLAPVEGKEFFVFHPAYGYFARRYGLRQMAVEVQGKEPTARQLAELIDRARAAEVRALFVQPQFSGSAPMAVADAAGCMLVDLDPLAEDHLAYLERMAKRIAHYAH
jgi:zinc transport system substrate-binding protein